MTVTTMPPSGIGLERISKHLAGIGPPFAEHLVRDRNAARPGHRALAVPLSVRDRNWPNTSVIGVPTRLHVLTEAKELRQRVVPAHQRHARLEDREALIDTVDGRLQQVAVVLDGG